ncbi:histone-lysine N-methyltransferase SETDB2 [Megalops cyprinoides]|uniref:histone-lysine N-methyltransferase SETDB2 n=1 Tax=Megalops cyprinoides TaxID=118141 RepID=UPI0018649093|nr:histone-lysine N-methyltransferase SETDB2 [Megalops cyprinoides]
MEQTGASEVEKAKQFWRSVDVDIAFKLLWDHQQYLRQSIKTCTATDEELIQGMNIMLAAELCLSAKSESDSIEEVFISAEILAVPVTEGDSEQQDLQDGLGCQWGLDSVLLEEESRCGQIQSSSPDDPRSPPQRDGADLLAPLSPLQSDLGGSIAPLSTSHSDGADLLAPLSPLQSAEAEHLGPLSPLQPSFQTHSCNWTCVPGLPLSVDHFRGHNPLQVPIMCRFQRQHAKPEGQRAGLDPSGPEVFYKAPCGRSLRRPAEVLRYLRETESDGVLHLGNFSFTPSVLLQHSASPPGGAAVVVLEPDISRGAEHLPVQLCNEVDGTRPEKFRYRKDRWPRGCFAGSGPIFSACCDCADGCVDRNKCSCLKLSLRAGLRAKLYDSRRLNHPVPSGIYECGPWCGCDRVRCQNRVVQHGLQVRLQVFRTQDRGWGVRCRDDLDRGTFVCTYTGVVMRAGLGLRRTGAGSDGACLGTVTSAPLTPKRKREEQSSDDDVEVVEEWRVPAVETGTPPGPSPPASPSLHVSVIQSPAGQDKEQAGEESAVTERSPWSLSLQGQAHSDAEVDEWEETEGVVKEAEPWLNSDWGAEPEREGGDMDECHGEAEGEHVYYLDATEEGNVGRFLNHSCCPNLFVQNVFMDSHNRNFPTVAFFTSRPVTAGTELTWNYSYDPGSAPEQEVPCQCGWESCQGSLI